MKINAVIFDMDGLMVDSETVWRKYFTLESEKYRVTIPNDFYLKICGTPESETRKIIKETFPNIDTDKYRDEIVENYTNHIINFGAEAKPGLFELIDYLKQNNIKMGIVSGNTLLIIKQVLSHLNISENIFECILCSDNKIKGKPAPDLFIEACKRFNVNPKNTIVLEDALNGIIGAHKAGCLPIMIPDLIMPNEQAKDLCFKIMDNLNDVIELLEEINNK